MVHFLPEEELPKLIKSQDDLCPARASNTYSASAKRWRGRDNQEKTTKKKKKKKKYSKERWVGNFGDHRV